MKAITFIVIVVFTLCQISPPGNVWAGDDLSNKIFNELNDNSRQLFSPTWALQPVLNENNQTNALNNTERYNDFENDTKKHSTEQDNDDDIKLKGPKGGTRTTDQGDAGVKEINLEGSSIQNPQEIPERIGEFLTERRNTVFIDPNWIQIDNVEGCYRLIWKEKDNQGLYSLHMKTFAPAGTPFQEVERTLSEGQQLSDINIYKTINYSNGDVSLIWIESEIDNGYYNDYLNEYIDMYRYYYGDSWSYYWEIDRQYYQTYYSPPVVRQCIKVKTFDKDGNEISQGSYTLTEDRAPKSASINQIIELAGGGISVIWTESNGSAADFLGMKVFDRNGRETGEGIYAFTEDRDPDSISIKNILTAPDGGLTIIWSEEKRVASSNSESGYITQESLMLKTFDRSGKEITQGAYNLSGDSSPQDIPGYNRIELSGGGTLFVLVEQDQSGSQELVVKAFDQNNREIGQGVYALTGNRAPLSISIDRTIMLADGGIILIWKETGRDGTASVVMRAFDKDGKMAENEYILTGERMPQSVSIDNTFFMPNGNFMIVWSEETEITDMDESELEQYYLQNFLESYGDDYLYMWDYYKDYYITPLKERSVMVKTFDRDGKELTMDAYDIIEDRVPVGISFYNTITLAGGGILLAWEERNRDGTKVLAVKAFDSNGQASDTGTHVLTESRNPVSVNIDFNQTMHFSDGAFAFIWTEIYADGSKGLAMKAFDKDGKEVENGSCLFTEGRHLANAAFYNTIAFSDGIVGIMWIEEDDNGNKFLAMKVFDGEGKAAEEGTCILTEQQAARAMAIDSIKSLPNGGVAVIWEESDADQNRSIFMKTFTAEGREIAQGTYTLSAGRAFDSMRLYETNVLDNGNIVFMWEEVKNVYDSEPVYNGWGIDYGSYTQDRTLRLKILDSEGKEIEPGSYLLADGDLIKSISVSQVLTLPDGSFGVSWTETDDNDKSSLKIKVFDKDGKAMSADPLTLIDDSSVYNLYTLQLISNANGSVSVLWYGVEGSLYDYYYQPPEVLPQKFLKLKTFSYDRSAAESTVQTLTGERVPRDINIQNIIRLSDGGLILAWSETDWDNSTSLMIKSFDKDGGEVTQQSALTGDRNPSSFRINTILTFPSGNCAILWQETDTAGKTSLRIKLFSGDGTEIGNGEYLLTGDRLPQGMQILKINTYSDGGISIIWEETTYDGWTSNRSLRMCTFDENGNILPGAGQTLTGDRVVNSISFNRIVEHLNGSFSLIWEETDVNGNKSLRVKTFDKDGKEKAGVENILTGGRLARYTYIDDVLTLSNGNIVIIWDETYADNSKSLRIKTLSQDGQEVEGGSCVIADSLNTLSVSYYHIEDLPNGGHALIYQKNNRSGGVELGVVAFDAEGKGAAQSRYVLTETRAPSSISIKKIETTGGGNLAIIWEELAYVNGKEQHSLWVKTFDRDGRETSQGNICLTEDRTPQSINITDIKTASNGDLVVFWEEIVRVSGQNDQKSLRVKTFTQDWQEVGRGSIAMTEDRTPQSAGIVNKIITPSGNLAVIWTETVRDYVQGIGYVDHVSLRVKIFDSEGKEVSLGSIPLTEGRAPQGLNIRDAMTTASGNIVFVWEEITRVSGQNDKKSLRLKTFTPDWQEISPGSIALTEDRTAQFVTIRDVITTPSGNIVVFWEEINQVPSQGSSYYYGYTEQKSLRLKTFTAEWQEVGQGSIALTEDRTPESINILSRNTSLDGNITIIWEENARVYDNNIGYVDQKTLHMKTFTAEWQKVYQGNIDLTEGRKPQSAAILSRLTASNGNIILLWEEVTRVSGQNDKRALRVKTFTPEWQEVGQGSITLTEDRIPQFITIANTFTMPDGSLAVIWEEKNQVYERDASYGYVEQRSMRMKIFDREGKALQEGAYLLTESRAPNAIEINTVTTTPDGKIVIIWKETKKTYDYTQNSNPGYYYGSYPSDYYFPYTDECSLRMEVFGEDGKEASGPYIFAEDRAVKDITFVDKFILANGNIAVVWKEKDNADKESLRMRAFDKKGRPVGSGSRVLLDDMHENSIYIHDIIAHENGNLSIIWEENASGPWSYYYSSPAYYNFNYNYYYNYYYYYGGYYYSAPENIKRALRMTTFSSYGTAPDEDYVLTGEESPSSITLKDMLTLPNGNNAIIWEETGSNNEKTIKVKIFDDNGKEVESKTHILTTLDEGRSLGSLFKVITNPEGGFTILWDETEDPYYGYYGYGYMQSLKLKSFDKYGKEVEYGVCGIAESGYINIRSLTTHSDGSFSLIWKATAADYTTTVSVRRFGPNGKEIKSESRNYSGNSSELSDTYGSHFIMVDTFNQQSNKNEIGIVRIFDENNQSQRREEIIVSPIAMFAEEPRDTFDFFNERQWKASSLLEDTIKSLSNFDAAKKIDRKKPVSLEKTEDLTPFFGKAFTFNPGDFIVPPDYRSLERGLQKSLSSYQYIDIRPAHPSGLDKNGLEDVVKILKEKEDRTDIENAVLEATEAAIRDSADMSEDVMQEFQEAVHLVRMAESMKGLLEGVDFIALTKAFTALTENQQRLYGKYLEHTETMYEEIEKMLGIKAAEEELPQRYLLITDISAQAKRKILLDLMMKKLAGKSPDTLLVSEKEALVVYKRNLEPLQQKYREDLKQLIEEFILNIKKTMMDAAPASTSKDKDEFKALFVLDSKKE